MLCQCLYTCWPWRPEIFLLLQWINSFQVFPVPETSRRGSPTIPILTHTSMPKHQPRNRWESTKHNPGRLFHHLLRWEENKNLLNHQSGFTLSSKDGHKGRAVLPVATGWKWYGIPCYLSSQRPCLCSPLIKLVLGNHFSELSLRVIFTDRL